MHDIKVVHDVMSYSESMGTWIFAFLDYDGVSSLPCDALPLLEIFHSQNCLCPQDDNVINNIIA